MVADRSCAFGRSGDVGEEHDLQRTFDVRGGSTAGEELGHVAEDSRGRELERRVEIHFDVARARNVLGEIPTVRDRNEVAHRPSG